MSTVVDPPTRAPAPRRRSGPLADGRTQLVVGALSAVQAATASVVVVLVPVVLAWATASYSRAPWGQAMRTGMSAWLLAHHTGLEIPGGHLGLVPLGLTAVPVISCWLAGVRVARSLDPNAEAVRAGIGRARPMPPPPRALMALVLTYAGLVSLAAVTATTASVRPLVWQAFAGAAVLCAVASVAGALAWVAGGALPGLRLLSGRLRLPSLVRRCLRPVALAVAVQLAGGLALVVAALVLGWSDVVMLHRALAPGLVGGVVLTVGQLMYLPSLAVWGAAWAAGPGFALGVDTLVTPGRTSLGPVPALPVLGALPPPGTGPAWQWAALALPVVSGVAAGCLIYRSTRLPVDRPVRGPGGPAVQLLRAAAVTTVLTWLVWTVLGWLASGPVGPGGLAQAGPRPVLLGLAVAAEVGTGVLLALGAGLVLRRLRRLRRRPSRRPDRPSSSGGGGAARRRSEPAEARLPTLLG